jgi:DtxR family transcriptional regulator, Mn-dependent transcriptional regulator
MPTPTPTPTPTSTPAPAGSHSATPFSQVAEDYLKAIWSATEWGGPATTTKALAERFGTTPATVSDTIKRLTARGLLAHAPYKAIELTPEGERHALQMVRRHRLIETFLVTSLGYSWDEVHDEAESLEHAASDVMIDRIDALLGQPSRDPHGDPIPTREGEIDHPTGALMLSDAGPGSYRVTRVSDADADTLNYFREHGLTPGTAISVTSRDEQGRTVLVIRETGRQLTLTPSVSAAMIVIPGGAGEESA